MAVFLTFLVIAAALCAICMAAVLACGALFEIPDASDTFDEACALTQVELTPDEVLWEKELVG